MYMIQDQRTVKAKKFYQTQSSQNDVTLFLRETLCLKPLNATLKQTFKLVFCHTDVGFYFCYISCFQIFI